MEDSGVLGAVRVYEDALQISAIEVDSEHHLLLWPWWSDVDAYGKICAGHGLHVLRDRVDLCLFFVVLILLNGNTIDPDVDLDARICFRDGQVVFLPTRLRMALLR